MQGQAEPLPVFATRAIPASHTCTIASAFNFRMTEMQAAIGLVQLKGLAYITERRRRIASYYDEVIPTGRRASADMFSIPVHRSLSDAEIETVGAEVRRLCEA